MKPTAEQQLSRKLQRRFHQAIRDFQLIDDGDRILVGLSGGKDSLFLLEMLAQRSRIDRPKFQVEAAHIRMSNVAYESDISYLQQFASRLGVRLHTVETSFETLTSADADGTGDATVRRKQKQPCFLCSWNRRKQMFQLAQQLGCNKIALGHHRDDILHTTLLNLIFQGQFSTMPAKLKMRKMPVTIIRPLCLEEEADIALYAKLHDYQKQTKLCPHETSSHRDTMKRLFDEIERINPDARFSLWNALEAEGKLTEE